MLVLVFVRDLPRARFNYFNPLEPVYLQITHFPTLAFPSSLCQSSEQQALLLNWLDIELELETIMALFISKHVVVLNCQATRTGTRTGNGNGIGDGKVINN